MYILFILTSLIFFISISLKVYSIQLIKLRELGWDLAQEEAHAPVKREAFTPGGMEKTWLFGGPPTNHIQSKHQSLTHYPIYFLGFLKFLFIRLPLLVSRVALYSFKEGKLSYRPQITDEQIFDVFIVGPLLLMSKMEGDYLQFRVPEIPLSSNEGINPSNLDVTFNYETKTIEKASWNGVDIKGDNCRILHLIISTLMLWVHPQSHVIAELSAREIAQKKVDILEPSNRYVVALHEGLLYGKYSPFGLNQPLSINMDKATVVESITQTRVPHLFDDKKLRFRYYRFLMESRPILFKLMRRYKLDVNPEFLFNNIIVHSVDHYLFYKNVAKVPAWSMEGDRSITSYYRSQIAISLWVPHMASSLQEERIGKMNPEKYPFYNDLYKELAVLDKELADQILASTSF